MPNGKMIDILDITSSALHETGIESAYLAYPADISKWLTGAKKYSLTRAV